MSRRLASVVLVVALFACVTAQAQVSPPAITSPNGAQATTVALGTDFSYQGYLTKSGQVYSGLADFKFQLYDAVSGGAQVGSDVTVSSLTVTNGLFTTQLDFGSVFDGSKRWLAVFVKTAGDAGFTELTPRRPVSAAPYAIRAVNGPAGASQWSNDATGIDYLAGNVGIGTGSLGNYKLWVNGGTANLNPLYVSHNNANYAALFTRNAATGGYGWVDDLSSRHWITGMFGIGVFAADYPLDVNGSGATVRITSTGSSFTYPGEGVRAALFVHGNTGTGPFGRTSGGIYSSSTDSRAVSGWSVNDWGVDGNNTTSGCYGVLGTLNEGVFGYSPNVAKPAAKFMAPTNGIAIDAQGQVKAKTVQITGGADLAEPFDVAGAGSVEAEPGAVVVIDAARPGRMRISDRAYDTRVAGIISGANDLAPGMVMKADGAPHGAGDHPVALSGRVWCKVDASFGAIHPGDLLTTSPVAGYAMLATDVARRAGAVIGKAMTSLEAGRGLVLVLVSLQ
jgi:hypothetical protein